MLRDVHAQGLADALARYGIKEAGPLDWARRAGTSAWEGVKATPGAMWRGLTGSPEARQQLMQGKAFAPGGSMSFGNVMWPTTGHPVAKWLGRAGTVLPALEAYSALRGRTGDPHEGRLTNALGSVGQALGNAYGFPVGGIIGSGMLSSVGHRLGKGLGRVLGSKPDAPPPMPPMYYPSFQQGAYPP